MQEYEDDELIKKLVNAFGNDVELFLSYVVPAGFPEDIISKTSQPRPAYTLFWKTFKGMDNNKKDKILDALRSHSSQYFKDLSSSSFRKRDVKVTYYEKGQDFTDIGKKTTGGENADATDESKKTKHNIRIADILPQVDVEKLDMCHRYNKPCDFQRPSLACVAEFARSDEAAQETLFIIDCLVRIKGLASNINKLKPGKYRDKARDKILGLKDAIDVFFNQLNKFKNKSSPIQTPDRAKKILTNRAIAKNNESAAIKLIDAITKFMRDYEGSHWYVTGCRDGEESLAIQITTISHYASYLIKHIINTLQKSMSESYKAIPEAFKVSDFDKISKCIEKALDNLSHNCGKAPPIWAPIEEQKA